MSLLATLPSFPARSGKGNGILYKVAHTDDRNRCTGEVESLSDIAAAEECDTIVVSINEDR